MLNIKERFRKKSVGLEPTYPCLSGPVTSLSKASTKESQCCRNAKRGMISELLVSVNKPGTAQVGAISRLKNSKRTSKCQSILLNHPKTQKLDRIGAPGKRFDIFRPFCRKISKKLKGGPFGDIKKICEKKSHTAEITSTEKFGQG